MPCWGLRLFQVQNVFLFTLKWPGNGCKIINFDSKWDLFERSYNKVKLWMLKCWKLTFSIFAQNVGWTFTVCSVSERTERLILSSTFVSDSENWSYFKSTFLWHLILRDSACSDLLVNHLILTCMMMNIWNLDKPHFISFYLDCNELHLRKTTACLRWCKR